MTTTRGQWAAQFLSAMNLPMTQNNLISILAWGQSEFGERQPPLIANYNLLATTQDAPGATNYNDVGVKNYPDDTTGVNANTQTLNANFQGYAQIRNALTMSQPPEVTCYLISASVWGSHPTNSIVDYVRSNFDAVASLIVGEGGSAPAPPSPPTPTEKSKGMDVRITVDGSGIRRVIDGIVYPPDAIFSANPDLDVAMSEADFQTFINK